MALEAGQLDEVDHLAHPLVHGARASQPAISSGSAMFFATVRQS